MRSRSQGVAVVAGALHHAPKTYARGRPGHRRRGTISTPQGVRWGWGRYALQTRRAWQTWH
eukprot:1887234-Pyramimonas_sp.AAC.1